MIRSRPGKPEDIRYVLSDPSPETRKEWGDYDIGALAPFINSTSHYFTTVMYRAVPVAVMGVIPFEGDYWCWSMTSRRFLKAYKPVTRFMRSLCQEITRTGKKIHMVTLSEHEQTNRWLKLIGFQYVKQTDEGKFFEFIDSKRFLGENKAPAESAVATPHNPDTVSDQHVRLH